MIHRSASSATPVRSGRGPARLGWLVLFGALGAGLLAPQGPARAQAAAVEPPAASGGTTPPPDIVKPRAAGPGDGSAGVIHPGVTGDAGMHMAPPADKSFPTPVIRPQTMEGNGTPVVPK